MVKIKRTFILFDNLFGIIYFEFWFSFAKNKMIEIKAQTFYLLNVSIKK